MSSLKLSTKNVNHFFKLFKLPIDTDHKIVYNGEHSAKGGDCMKFPEIKKRFEHVLQLRKMTAQELSDRSGVGKSSISHYVNGSNEPHNKNAWKMAKVLKCNPQWLMGFDVSFEMPETDSFTYTDDDGKKRTIAIPKGYGALLEGETIIMKTAPNYAFTMDMYDLTKTMSPDGMERIKLFAQFLKQQEDVQKPDEDKKPDDDKKSDE